MRLAWLRRTRLSWKMATPTTISRVTKERITGSEMLCSKMRLLEDYFGRRTTLHRGRGFMGRRTVKGEVLPCRPG